MRRAALVACACAFASRTAAAKPASLFGGVVTAELPRGWRVDGSDFTVPHGKGRVDVAFLITDGTARARATAFRDGAIDDIADASINKGNVGGLPGLIVNAGTAETGGVLEAADTCLGTITIRAVWFDDESAALRSQLRAIVSSAKLRITGGGFADADAAAIDPKARALADHVVEALCADDGPAFAALAAPSVRVRDAARRDLARETLIGEIRQLHGPRAYTAMPSGPFSLAARDDGSVDLFTIAAAPAGAKDSGFVTLRKVNGAWRIAAIARTLDSPP